MASQAHHYLYIYDKDTRKSLYLGRTKRLASAAQRIVLHSRERGCTRPGCTASGCNSQVHQAVAGWKNNGQTNIDDLTLACPPDNQMIEKTDWTTRKNSGGHTEWLPHLTSTPAKPEPTTTTTPSATYSPKTTRAPRRRRGSVG